MSEHREMAEPDRTFHGKSFISAWVSIQEGLEPQGSALLAESGLPPATPKVSCDGSGSIPGWNRNSGGAG
ncbi:MAG: hypothetical protein HY211_04945 [Candidatus Omnitrophica bacterium]|nr:hypothetical protein [Candidatus Omnitrophota bacterium]